MYHPLSAKTIERISASQTPVRPATLEERLVIVQDLIYRADRMGATADMKARWQSEAETIELQLETEKALEIVAANLNQFKMLRVAVAEACLIAEEVQTGEPLDIVLWLDEIAEPTDEELRAIEEEPDDNGFLEWLDNLIPSYSPDNPRMCEVRDCINPTGSSPHYCKKHDPRTEAERELDDWRDERNSRPFPY